MIYSDNLIENVRKEIHAAVKVKQVLFREQIAEDLYYKGLGHKGEDYYYRFKPTTGRVFYRVGIDKNWYPVNGLKIEITPDKM